MTIVFTILACAVVFVAQAWVLPLFGVLISIITLTPSRMVVRTIPISSDMEAYAAEHPWRIHVAAFLFRWGMVIKELIFWGLFLLLLNYVSRLTDAVMWQWVYIVSFLIFLGALNNARTLNSQYNSLSYRLKGGLSELRYHHGQRDLPPDEVRGPITPTRQGF